jgi:hypothetical protein
MPHLRPFLLLFIAGLVSTLVLQRNPTSTDSLGGFSKTSISARDGANIMAGNSWTTRSAPADDSKGLEGSRPSDEGTPSQDTPMDAVSLTNVSLVRRAAFTSPHDRRAFVLNVATSSIITSANWLFELWLVKKNEDVITLWRGGGYTGSTNLQQVGVTVANVVRIVSSTDGYEGKADFILSGFKGVSDVVVKFTAEFFASATQMYIQDIIQGPTCTIANADVTITSWSFDKA